MFIAALFTIVNKWKQPKYSTTEWIKKMYTHTNTHTHTMEYYSAIKRTKILTLATTQMDLQGVMLTEMSDKESQILYDIT